MGTEGTRRTYFAKPSLLANTLRLGPEGDADVTMWVLIDLNRPPIAAGQLLLNAYAGSLVAFGVRQRLEACWASQHMDEVIQRRRDQGAALHVNALLHLARYSRVADGAALAERVQRSRDEFKRVSMLGSLAPMQFNLDDLRGCIVIGGYEKSATFVLERVLLCQQRTTGAVEIVDLQDGKTYPDITALLRQYVAYYLVNIDTKS